MVEISVAPAPEIYLWLRGASLGVGRAGARNWIWVGALRRTWISSNMDVVQRPAKAPGIADDQKTNGYKTADPDAGRGRGRSIGSSASCGETGTASETYLYVVFRNWASRKFEYEDAGKEDESRLG